MSASRRLASRRCSSACQHLDISLPEVFHDLVLRSDSSSRQEASRRSASVFQRRLLWLPRPMFAADGILSGCRDERLRDARRRFASVVSCGFPHRESNSGHCQRDSPTLSSWSQGISTPSLVKYVHPFSSCKQTNTQTHNFNFICKVISASFGFKGLMWVAIVNFCSPPRIINSLQACGSHLFEVLVMNT
jgi:hypothetical protein